MTDRGAGRGQHSAELDGIVETAARAASRMAHDLNNLLTAVGGYVEIARARLTREHPADEALAEALKATDRASEKVRKIHAFARFPDPKPAPVDLTAFLGERLPSWRLIFEPVLFAVEPPTGAVVASTDAYLLELILQHVLRNAKEAGAEGTPIRLRVVRVAAGAVPPLVGGAAVSQPRLLFAVSDQGSGFEEEAWAHLFEPFFTTKPRADHLGLGLASAYRIARRLDAQIRIESSKSGTTVGVLLPAAP